MTISSLVAEIDAAESAVCVPVTYFRDTDPLAEMTRTDNDGNDFGHGDEAATHIHALWKDRVSQPRWEYTHRLYSGRIFDD